MSLQENPSGKAKTEELAIQAAQEVLGVTGDWCVLKKGMTNRSYTFRANGKRYIIRIPGEGTEHLINRKQEADVYSVISGHGFCDDPVYLNPETGIKITEYLDGVKTCDPYHEGDLKRCMEILRRLHGLKLKVDHTFDLFGQISFYESLWNRKSLYQDYEEMKSKVFSLMDYIDVQEKECCLSHIDAVCDNFLFYDRGLQLTDWEYAGMQDPHIDIAMFCVYADYSREQVDRLIDIYFDGKCSLTDRIKIYCYIASCGLLWSNWCEYKHQLGIEFGEYALRQYRYAGDYYEIAVREMKKL